MVGATLVLSFSIAASSLGQSSNPLGYSIVTPRSFSVRAQKAQRQPAISVTANYGGGGANINNFNQVYTIAGSVSVPIYTGGRIRADIEQALVISFLAPIAAQLHFSSK